MNLSEMWNEACWVNKAHQLLLRQRLSYRSATYVSGLPVWRICARCYCCSCSSGRWRHRHRFGSRLRVWCIRFGCRSIEGLTNRSATHVAGLTVRRIYFDGAIRWSSCLSSGSGCRSRRCGSDSTGRHGCILRGNVLCGSIRSGRRCCFCGCSRLLWCVVVAGCPHESDSQNGGKGFDCHVSKKMKRVERATKVARIMPQTFIMKILRKFTTSPAI